MDNKDIESAKRLKNTMWTPSLKDFYEPEDVVRYYDEISRLDRFPRGYGQELQITPPDKFFTEEVYEKGMELRKERYIKELRSDIAYLEEVKIPNLKEELKRVLEE